MPNYGSFRHCWIVSTSAAALLLCAVAGAQLPLGAALPEWVQAQCTYAKLKKDEEGKWVLQVLKQKIWVDGVSYELQEIYGMEATRTGD
jgi:hypothetical protein